jgi:two-component sensor histidine kinase
LNIYTRKKRWKLFLLAVAVLIITGSLWYTNILVRRIAEDQRNNIRTWADAIHRKAELVNYTEDFFRQLEKEERKRLEITAEAYKRIAEETDSDALNFYLDIISNNTTVPVILTDDEGEIKETVNVDFDKDTVKYLRGRLKAEYMEYPPIRVSLLPGKFYYFYYKDSRLFTELRTVLGDLIENFIAEIVVNSASVPVIITDSTRHKVIQSGMIDPHRINDTAFMIRMIRVMESENDPIEIMLAGQGKTLIFYKNSEILNMLRYYPFAQIGVVGLFLMIAYFLFSTARKSEQNQVWVGMAKETAHQIGTPLSSMIAWVELLRMQGVEEDTLNELTKDVERLQIITERFSKIGSEPRLETHDIVKVVHNTVDYIRTRSSKRISFRIIPSRDVEIYVPLNIQLFGWVIENLCKNSIDAMGGSGEVDIRIFEEGNSVIIDFSDTGKGIPKSKFKAIFNPGFTGKKHGWGLGLTLARRIVENYHKGKIFVKSSALNKGTTFRIVIKARAKSAI